MEGSALILISDKILDSFFLQSRLSSTSFLPTHFFFLQYSSQLLASFLNTSFFLQYPHTSETEF